MQIQGIVGAPAAQSLQPGTSAQARLGQLGDAIISELHGQYYEGAYRKTRFGGSMQALLATATIAGLGTTVTGTTVLYNPPGNSNNVVIEKFGVGFVLAPAAPLIYGLATGFSTTALSGTLTSLTPKSKNIGSGIQPTAGLVASASVTLPVAATVDQVLGHLDTGAVTTVTNVASLFDIQGSIILPPGGFCHLWTSAALLASAHMASFQWEEVPI